MATVAVASLALASCAGTPAENKETEESGTGSSAPAESSSDNPFGVAEGSTIDIVGFDGAYGVDYVEKAAEMVKENIPDLKVDVKATTQIATELQPLFVAGDPPDLVDNQGPDMMVFSSIADQLTELNTLWQTENYDGDVIEDAVFPNVQQAGTHGGKFVAVNYVMTLFSLWYSETLFEENGYELPKTWDDMGALCTQAKADDRYLFAFGKEAADYYSWMVLDSAIKQGGLQVIEDIFNLVPGAWENPAVAGAVEAMGKLVADGCFIPGGAGTQFTQAQARWSLDQDALFYYSGSWIDAEMKDTTADNFEMKAWPAPIMDDSSVMPFEAVQAGANEPFIVPANSANAAGGQEILRAMLSKDVASEFSKTHLAPTVVKDTVPADGFGSSSLASTMGLMEEAGDNIFSWVGNSYIGYYGMGPDSIVLWNSFLSGDINAEEMIAAQEALSAKIANDASIEKFEYTF